MTAKEIKASELNAEQFISDQVEAISSAVGDGLAINALSGGVDSSAVTLLGHRALGDRLKTYFVQNGLMRQGEPEFVVALFAEAGVKVELVDAREEFFEALRGVTDPEEKREAVTQTFYQNVFARLVRESGAKHLLQGTILTDIDETVAGIKRQHNVFEQLGIDPEEAFGYQIIEPVVQLRKDGVRLVAKALGLPESVYDRPPFPVSVAMQRSSASTSGGLSIHSGRNASGRSSKKYPFALSHTSARAPPMAVSTMTGGIASP